MNSGDQPAAAAEQLAALARAYPCWTLTATEYGYAAEHRSQTGRSVRYIAAGTVEGLAERLATAEVVEP